MYLGTTKFYPNSPRVNRYIRSVLGIMENVEGPNGRLAHKSGHHKSLEELLDRNWDESILYSNAADLVHWHVPEFAFVQE